MTRFRIYVRLSLTRGNDISIDRQLSLAHDYWKEHPNLQHDCSSDDYIEPKGRRSGADEKHRPRWRDLLRDLEKSAKESSVLWSYDLSRLTRADDLMILLQKLSRWNCEVIAYRDDVDLKTLSGRTNIRVKQLLNSMFRDDISDRKQKYFEVASRQGWIVAVTPSIGLELVGSKQNRHYIASDRGVWLWNGSVVYGRESSPPVTKSLVFHSYLSTLKRACELIASGLSLRATALQLRAERYYWTRHDGTPALVCISHLTIEKLLPILSRYREFLDPALIDSAIARIKERSRNNLNGSRVLSPERIPALYKLVYCSECNHRLSFSYHSSNAGYYYHHSYLHCVNHRGYPAVALDNRVLEVVKDVFCNADAVFDEVVKRMTVTEEKPNRKARLDTIEHKLDNAKRHLMNELITESDYRMFKTELEGERDSILQEPECSPRLSPDSIRRMFRDVPAMIDALRFTQRDRLNVALRDVIERVVLTGEDFEIIWKAGVREYLAE